MVQAIAVVASLLLLAIVLPGCTPLAATSAVAAPQQQQQQQQSQRRTWHARDIGDAAAAAAADAATAANIVARRSLAETAVPASTTLGFLFPLTNHAAGAARAAAAMVVTECVTTISIPRPVPHSLLACLFVLLLSRAINAGDDTFLAGIKLSEVLPNTTLEYMIVCVHACVHSRCQTLTLVTHVTTTTTTQVCAVRHGGTPNHWSACRSRCHAA